MPILQASAADTSQLLRGKFSTPALFSLRCVNSSANPVYPWISRIASGQIDVGQKRIKRSRKAHKCFHGQRGELQQGSREGTEDELGALWVS